MPFKVNCNFCEKEFSVTPSRFNTRNMFYCSKECESSFRRAEPNMECPVCGKRFHIKPYRINRLRTNEKVCCSKKCFYITKKEMCIGELNHQYGIKGELNSSFKSDIKFSNYGYILIRNTTHPLKTKDNFMFVHRLIMEEHLRANYPDSTYLISIEGYKNKFLDVDIKVHHKNEDKLDNRIDNLECMSLSDHTRLHCKLRNYKRNKEGDFVKIAGKKLKNDNSKNNLIKKIINDAGLDVVSSETITVKSNNSVLVCTDLYIEVPINYVGLLWSRSGLSVKNKIEVGAGCIDSSYRGEVKVHLYNYGKNDYIVNKGDRIAQLLTIPINTELYEEVDELPDSERGLGGFGHTGV